METAHVPGLPTDALASWQPSAVNHQKVNRKGFRREYVFKRTESCYEEWRTPAFYRTAQPGGVRPSRPQKR